MTLDGVALVGFCVCRGGKRQICERSWPHNNGRCGACGHSVACHNKAPGGDAALLDDETPENNKTSCTRSPPAEPWRELQLTEGRSIYFALPAGITLRELARFGCHVMPLAVDFDPTTATNPLGDVLGAIVKRPALAPPAAEAQPEIAASPLTLPTSPTPPPARGGCLLL